MPNLVEVTYEQTGQSTNTDELGMREMQARAYAARTAQHLLIKAPPASGKSRALMFLALDKMCHQGVNKTIVAVPERSIGASFASTRLSENGFFTDWEVKPKWNLCTPGGEQGKVRQFEAFLQSDDKVIVCTHATLRFAFEAIDTDQLNDVLVAIDEFHHVSVDADNRLGAVLQDLLNQTSAHVIAMTGSYFRGDSVPVLLPEDEARFTHVVYNYYEQLNGYEYLKSLGIGYHFYQGKYTTAISEILDTDKKTILHIPRPNSGESTKDKYAEVDFIIDAIGEVVETDPDTRIMTVKRHSDGKLLKVADLVLDDAERDKVINFLRQIGNPEDMDLIIALGMAKEGFDWVYCEHALTVGYRGSLTEVVQIIGRCTRDSKNKTHAQFTNLIAQPVAADAEVTLSVNNMLKAISCSLLMEQVLAPSFKFKTRTEDDDTPSGKNELKIKGFKEPSSKRVKDIVESDLNDLKATILSDSTMQKTMTGNIDPEVINKILIPKIIRTKYPDLTEKEYEEIRQHVVVDSVLKGGKVEEAGDKRFIRMAGKFVNIDELNIDLIDSINPFQRAFEILSKQVTTNILKAIMECIEMTRIQMTEAEAILLWPKIKQFVKTYNREPALKAPDALEHRMAEALAYIKHLRREKGL